jgi:hypothetical protein
MRYGHVTNGVIDKGPCSLPKSWENVSGLNNMSDAQLRDIGWLPWILEGVILQENQVVSGSTIKINTTEIVETPTVRNLNQQEIDGLSSKPEFQWWAVAQYVFVPILLTWLLIFLLRFAISWVAQGFKK